MHKTLQWQNRIIIATLNVENQITSGNNAIIKKAVAKKPILADRTFETLILCSPLPTGMVLNGVMYVTLTIPN